MELQLWDFNYPHLCGYARRNSPIIETHDLTPPYSTTLSRVIVKC